MTIPVTWLFMPVTQRESLTELGGINIPIIGYSICDRLDLTVLLILWDNIRYMTRIWYSVQSEKSVNYTYTYIRMSYYQRSIQNVIQKIKINEVLIIKSQRQSKCEETSLLGEIMRQTKSSQYACARELRVMN